MKKTQDIIVPMTKCMLRLLPILLLVSICLPAAGCVSKEEPAPGVIPAPEREEKAGGWDVSTHQKRTSYESRDSSATVPNGEAKTKQERLPGDYDGDGKVTELDALAALRMSADLLPEDLIVDMDADGAVTADDARMILARSIQAGTPLSEEQEQIIREFGRPDSFTIMEVDESEGHPVRHESWTYYEGEITYLFADGVFQTWQETTHPQGDIIAAPYSPDDFIMGASVDELECLAAENEWLRVESTDYLLEGVVEGVDIYVNLQVAVGFYDGRLFYVEAMALVPEEGS